MNDEDDLTLNLAQQVADDAELTAMGVSQAIELLISTTVDPSGFVAYLCEDIPDALSLISRVNLAQQLLAELSNQASWLVYEAVVGDDE